MIPDILADVNNDGIVDIYDLVMVGKAYGSETGDSLWDPECDINSDGIIDIFDLAIIGKDYGKTS